MTHERLSDESVNEIITQMATEEISFLRRLIRTLEIRVRADMLVEKAVLKGIDDMAAKEERSHTGDCVAEYAYTIGAEDLHDDGHVLAITRSQLAQCVKHFNSDNAELIDRLATIHRLAAQEESAPERSEAECYVLEHLMQLGAECIHDDAEVLAVSSSQILKLLSDRGGVTGLIFGEVIPATVHAKDGGGTSSNSGFTLESALSTRHRSGVP